MIVGIVKEAAPGERRVAATPDSVTKLSQLGFNITVESGAGHPSFIVSGSAEVPEGKANYREHIVNRGESGPSALRGKVRWVLEELERRMRLLGTGWQQTTAVQVYTVHDFHPFVADEMAPRGAARNGLDWHFDRPPVVDLEFEMDCRAVHRELIC